MSRYFPSREEAPRGLKAQILAQIAAAKQLLLYQLTAAPTAPAMQFRPVFVRATRQP